MTDSISDEGIEELRRWAEGSSGPVLDNVRGALARIEAEKARADRAEAALGEAVRPLVEAAVEYRDAANEAFNAASDRELVGDDDPDEAEEAGDAEFRATLRFVQAEKVLNAALATLQQAEPD